MVSKRIEGSRRLDGSVVIRMNGPPNLRRPDLTGGRGWAYFVSSQEVKVWRSLMTD